MVAQRVADWDDPALIARLGKEPDKAIAKDLGCSNQTVAEKRRSLGIAAWDSGSLELAQQWRRKILDAILFEGAAYPARISGVSKIGPDALSRYLAWGKRQGLVTRTQRGLYELTPRGVGVALGAIPLPTEAIRPNRARRKGRGPGRIKIDSPSAVFLDREPEPPEGF